VDSVGPQACGYALANKGHDTRAIQKIKQSLQGDWKSFIALLKKGFKLGLIRRIQVPAFNSGVITLPFEYWHEKLAERPQAIREELARRNALWAKGLPYND
jgi:hypothetical protein